MKQMECPVCGAVGSYGLGADRRLHMQFDRGTLQELCEQFRKNPSGPVTCSEFSRAMTFDHKLNGRR